MRGEKTLKGMWRGYTAMWIGKGQYTVCCRRGVGKGVHPSTIKACSHHCRALFEGSGGRDAIAAALAILDHG
jgi:hypothetical protein